MRFTLAALELQKETNLFLSTTPCSRILIKLSCCPEHSLQQFSVYVVLLYLAYGLESTCPLELRPTSYSTLRSVLNFEEMFQ